MMDWQQQAYIFWQGMHSKPLFGLFVSLVAYQLALMFYQFCDRRVIAHPVSVGSVIIAIILYVWDIPYEQFKGANELLYLLLGPATVALAVPLYQQSHHTRKLTLPVLITVLIGGAFAAIAAVAIAWIMGGSDETLLALAPKSVTTPIALGVAEAIGALPELTTGVVVFTGVIGALMTPYVFSITKLTDPRLQGVVLGINAHGVGTARAFEISSSCGAFASLAMGLTGTFTALVLPYLITLF